MGTQLAWMGVVGVLAPVVAATLVLTGVLATIRQKDRTDQKDQWWKRVQWSAELVISPDEQRRTLGLAALTALIERTEKIQDSDAGLIEAIIGQVDVSNQHAGHQSPRSVEGEHDGIGITSDGGTGSRGTRAGGARQEDEEDVA